MRSLSLADQVGALARAVAAEEAARIEQQRLAAVELEKKKLSVERQRSGQPTVSARIVQALGDGQKWRGNDLLTTVGCGSKSLYGALGKLITAGRVEREGRPFKFLYRLA